jgi:alkanesulfonate monooxygenase SsuD/methylene tetrahydromethanopterin reductase-like flavin-dependent oxidoreductase (luciferase family)
MWEEEPTWRAARYGDGWYGFHTDPEATKRSVEWIRGYIENGARPSELGDLEISVTPPVPISKEVIRQHEDIGVHRLIPWLNAPTLEGGWWKSALSSNSLAAYPTAVTTVAEHQGKRGGYARYVLALANGKTFPLQPTPMPL